MNRNYIPLYLQGLRLTISRWYIRYRYRFNIRPRWCVYINVSAMQLSRDAYIYFVQLIYIIQVIKTFSTREGWWYIGIKGDGGVKSKGTRLLIEKEK